MRLRIKEGFTLVELIVVVTILSILATIGYVSFIGYQISARESKRLNDVKIIEKQLSLFEIRTNTLPLPDNAVTITASGTTIGYQGEVGTGVLVSLNQPGESLTDPLDGGLYSYFVDTNRVNYQLLSMMERQDSLRASFTPYTYAATDYSERYPRTFGKALGIMTDANKTPLEKIAGLTSLDVVNQTGTGYTAYYSDTDNITGTGVVLRDIIQNANCKRIKQLTNVNPGVYEINPRMGGLIEVYCDMTIDGGGWMLVGRTSTSIPSNVQNTSGFGWAYSTGSVINDGRPYSLGMDIAKIDFDQILIAAYDTGKEITAAVRLDIDRNFFQSQITAPQAFMEGDDTISGNADDQTDTTSNCEMIYNTKGLDEDCFSNYKYWGAFGYEGKFVFNRQEFSEEGFVFGGVLNTWNNGLPKDADTGGSDPEYHNMRGENGMILVR